ncbi:MAG: beta strand repeat-containing protein, partial [Bacteroidales bacterium]
TPPTSPSTFSILYTLSGIYTVGPTGDYATIEAAINALNNSGIGSGGVTINVPAGHTETFSTQTAGILNATGTLANPIIFQKCGTGANPMITAATGTTTNSDGIIKIAGGDYITFDSIDVQENIANLTPTTQMEWGYAIVKGSSIPPVNGCQFVTIKNCSITLNKSNTASVGIYSGNHLATETSSVLVTVSSDATNNCKIQGNTISNVYVGISLNGYAAVADLSLYDLNNEISGNYISNYGGGSNLALGITTIYNGSLKVDSNNITGGTANNTVYGIYITTANSQDITISSNRIYELKTSNTTVNSQVPIYCNAGSTPNNNTVLIYNNLIENCYHYSTSDGKFYGIRTTSAPTYLIIRKNIIRNDTLRGSTTSGFLSGISVESNAVNCKIDSNEISSNAIASNSTSSFPFYGVLINNGAVNTVFSINNNFIYNNSFNYTSSSGVFYGIYNTMGNATESYFKNSIYNNTHLGTGAVYGISLNTASGTATKSIYNNSIYNLTGKSTIYGIYSNNGNPANCYNNLIYGLETSSTSGGSYGISVAPGPSLFQIYNNIIYGLKATTASNADAIRAINITSTTILSTIGIYYNSIYLDATSSGTNFGTSGIYHTANATATTATLDMRNNIIVNNSTANGTGITVAYRRSNINLSNFNTVSNNNLFYAGIPSTKNLIFYDGTNSDQTLSTYQARVSPRESESVTEMPPFINTAFLPYNLHIDFNISTQAESRGQKITSPAITTDFDGDIRWGETAYIGTGTSTDIGADEFELVSTLDITATALLSPDNINGCYSNAETVTVTVKNNASTTIDFSVNPLTVTTDITGAAITNLTRTINTGTLAPNTTLNVDMSSTLDMTAAGIYTFIASTNVVGDVNTANDTMAVNKTKTDLAVGGTANGSQAVCQNSLPSDITLSGNVGSVVKWQKSADIAFTTPIDYTNNTTTLSGAEIGFLSATTYFRAYVQNNTCTDAFSSIATINIQDVPTSLNTITITPTSAKIGWIGFAYGFEIEYGVAPYNFTGISTETGITSNSITISGLNQATSYQYKVKAICTGGGSSEWSAIGDFTTTTVPTPGLWTGAISIDWSVAGNWSDNNVPGTSTNVIIPSSAINQPHITTPITSAPSICNNLTINAGAVLIIDAGKALSVNGTITNNAGTTGLQIKSSNAGSGSLLHTTAAINASVERFIPHTNTDEFHMLASPVAAQSISPDFNQLDGFYLWNEATANWIGYSDGSFASENGGSNFVPGKGYAVSYPSAITKTFAGALNQGNINIPLSFTAGTYGGWNFVANPYPSSINWDAAGGWTRTDLDDAGGGENAMWIWNAGLGNYGTYISNAGTGTGTNDVTADIPLSQGFWVKAINTGTLGMTNAVRSHSSQAFLKSSSSAFDRVRLTVTGTTNSYSDEIIVKFGNADDLGGAPKMFSIDLTAPSLYSTKMNKNWSINYLTTIAQNNIIPVGFKSGVSGNYTLHASELNSSTTPTYIYLKDLAINSITDLNQNADYTFSASTTDNPMRFQLLFELSPLRISNNTILNTSIYLYDNTIYINSNETIHEIAIYNTLGKLIKTFANGLKITIDMKENATGYYFVRVVTAKNVYSEKVLVK